MTKAAFVLSLLLCCGASGSLQQVMQGKPVSNMVKAPNSVPMEFFGLSIFGTPTCQNNVCNPATSFPLQDSVVPGTLGKVGFISGFYIEPTCDGGTSQMSPCYHWA